MRVRFLTARFMKACSSAPNSSGPRIGDAAEPADFAGEAGDDEGRAEGARVRGLAVALVGHVLGADGAHVGFHVLVEHRVGARGEVRHDVFADQAVAVGEALVVAAGGRVQHQPRILRRPGGQDDDVGGLHLLLAIAVVVFDARHLVAGGVGEHARHRAPAPALRRRPCGRRRDTSPADWRAPRSGSRHGTSRHRCRPGGP